MQSSPRFIRELFNHLQQKMAAHFTVFVAIVVSAFAFAYAHDPSPLQDFCVAVNDSDAAGKKMNTNVVEFLHSC